MAAIMAHDSANGLFNCHCRRGNGTFRFFLYRWNGISAFLCQMKSSEVCRSECRSASTNYIPVENKWLYLYNPDALTEKQLRADADTIKLACEIDYSSTSHGDEMQSALQRNDDDSFDFVLIGLILSLNRVLFLVQFSQTVVRLPLQIPVPRCTGFRREYAGQLYVSLHHGDIALLRMKCLDESLSSPRRLAQSARCVYDSIDLSEDELRLPRTTSIGFSD